MPDVVTLGESMLRLAVPVGQSLEQADSLQVFIAGAESNVAITLARLGVRAGWVSRLVDDPLGRRIASFIRGQGVDTSRVIWTETGRTGLYFAELSPPPRGVRIFYDRRYSAMAAIRPEEVDWSYVCGARLVHLTGITPALSETCLATVHRAIQEARAARIPISFDINYRAMLWSPAQAAQTLRELVDGVDVLICSRRDAIALFQAPDDPEPAAAQLAQIFHARTVVLTLGETGALAWQEGRWHHQEAVRTSVVDPIGRGDAFAAGFLWGYLQDDIARGLRRGVRLAALCQTFLGDVAWFAPEDLEAFEGQSGDVIR